MPKDPVCNQEVNETSAWTSTYQGQTFYFSSPDCKADFDRDPARYSSFGSGAAGETIKAQGARAASRARTKIRSVIGSQKDQIAERIGSVSIALKTASQRLKEQNQEPMARYADTAAARVDDLAGYLQEHDADQIIHEAEEFVRHRPALAVGSALAAGFLAARFFKSSKAVAT